METATMGKIVVNARIENIYDLYEVEKGTLAPDQVRQVEITDAVVDTGAGGLGLSRQLIQQLGLKRFGTRQARTAAGTVAVEMFGLVRLTIQGRFCHVEVTEVAQDCPVLIGQVPLEVLDFVIDPKGQRLIGNPDHGGQYMIDLL
jgi:predicted aspartyl protease